MDKEDVTHTHAHTHAHTRTHARTRTHACTRTHAHTHTHAWKQPKCPSTEEWIKKMWYIYINTMEYYSAIKRNKIVPFEET